MLILRLGVVLLKTIRGQFGLLNYPDLTLAWQCNVFSHKLSLYSQILALEYLPHFPSCTFDILFNLFMTLAFCQRLFAGSHPFIFICESYHFRDARITSWHIYKDSAPNESRIDLLSFISALSSLWLCLYCAVEYWEDLGVMV